jgi:hypothetical protein
MAMQRARRNRRPPGAVLVPLAMLFLLALTGLGTWRALLREPPIESARLSVRHGEERARR